MILNKTMANAVGGRNARACDSCIKKRARWYCAADDAFLCQACDSSVHSANPLARRHERVRLKTASLKSLNLVGSKEKNSVPSWHQGFTRKARTPRHGNKSNINSKFEETIRNPFPLIVPQVGSDEISNEENEEEHLLYRVPIFDPLVAELCTSTTNSNEAGGAAAATPSTTTVNNNHQIVSAAVDSVGYGLDGECLQGFLPSDMDLEEFAADVESLLGKGLENECFGMEELGLMDCKQDKEYLDGDHSSFESDQKKVKLEEELLEEEEGTNTGHVDTEIIDMEKEPPFELNFDYDSPAATCEEEDDQKAVSGKSTELNSTSGEYEADDDDATKKKKKKRKRLLSLDYESVISAWASQGSPWADGNRPDFDPDECWPDCMGSCGTQFQHPCVTNGLFGHPAKADGGREARVSRYREKRRTRLFSKKIRYEVRKLNAEKRPRMKGRFVKRATTFTGPAAFPLLK